MYSKTKATKGSVSVESFRGYLRLRFRVAGERYCIYLGLADTPENQKLAEIKAKTIESDIIYEQFDPTLAKYKSAYHLKVVNPSNSPIRIYNLAELWEKYVDFKRPSLSPSTIANSLKSVENHLKKMPSQSLSDGSLIRDWCIANLTLDTAKRTLVQLNACCNWAVNSGLIDSNPFVGMASEIKITKAQRSSELTDINPFTKEERDAIIEALKTNKYCHPSTAKGFKHSNYAAYIEFLFFVGCRPSEAIALQWKHITDRYIIFEQAVVHTENGRQVKPGLKTQDSRRFPINQQLRSFLDSIKPEDYQPDSLVFPSPKGGWIDQHNFSNRIWKPLLEKMGIPYRKPYQTRHTFITLCLQAGTPIQDVARVSGNSPEIILKHYAGNRRDLQVPEL